MATTSPQHSHLLSIPRELRDSIWSLSLTDPNASTDIRRGHQVRWINRSLTPPALLATCRQTRSEVGEIYYCKTKFLSSSFCFSTVRDWLTTLPQPALSQIKFLGLVEPSPTPPSPWIVFSSSHWQMAPVFGGLESYESPEDRQSMLKTLEKIGLSHKAVKFLTPSGYATWTIEEVDGESWKDAGVLVVREPESEMNEIPPLVGENEIAVAEMD